MECGRTCANPLIPMENELNTHDQTDVMDTLKECSISYISLDLKGPGQSLGHKKGP